MNRQDALSAALARLRRRVRLAMLTGGVGRLLCLAVALTAADFGLDRWLRLPVPARAFLLAAVGCVLLWQAVRGVVLPLLRRLPDAELAVELERRRGGMADLLSSALSFRAGAGSSSSPALQRVVVDEAERVAGNLHPAELLDWRRVRNRLLAGAILLCLVAAAAVLRPETAGLWVRRNVLLSQVEWPRRTRLELTGFAEGVRHVARGADAAVSARARGVIPEMVRLHVREREKGSERRFPMTRVAGNTFSVTLERVVGDFELQARGGDGVSAQVRLVAVERPRVSAAHMVVDPPDYIDGEPVEVAWDSGEVRVPRGSRVTLQAEASKPLSAGNFRLGDSPARPLQLVEPHVARCTFSVEDTVHCKVTFADLHGVETEDALRVTVHAVRDAPPDLRLSAPGVGDMATPRARIPLVLRVEDDYGIAGAWLDVEVEGQGQTRQFPRISLSGAEGRRVVQAEERLDLEQMGAGPGGRLSILATARDNRPEPNVGRASPIVLRLVTVPQFLRAMLLRQEDLRRDLEQSIERQKGLVEELAFARGEALRELAWTEAPIAEETERLAEAYRAVLDEMRINRLLTGPPLRARAAEIVEPLEALSGPGGALRLAAERLGSAEEGAMEPARVALSEMQAVRAHMLLMEGFAALAVSVEEIGEDQQAILERTRERQRGGAERIGGS